MCLSPVAAVVSSFLFSSVVPEFIVAFIVVADSLLVASGVFGSVPIISVEEDWDVVWFFRFSLAADDSGVIGLIANGLLDVCPFIFGSVADSSVLPSSVLADYIMVLQLYYSIYQFKKCYNSHNYF